MDNFDASRLGTPESHPHQQNGNFDIQHLQNEFGQVNTSSAPVAVGDNQHELQAKMGHVDVLHQIQNPNTYYWNDYNATNAANINWAYYYSNYSIPPAPVAIPVSHFSVNHEPQSQPPLAIQPNFSFPVSQQLNAAAPNNHPAAAFFARQPPEVLIPTSDTPTTSAFHKLSPMPINLAEPTDSRSVLSTFGYAPHNFNMELNTGKFGENMTVAATRQEKPNSRTEQDMFANIDQLVQQARTSATPGSSTSINTEDSSSGEAQSSSGVKLKLCDICNNTFSTSAVLRRHRHKVHNIDQDCNVRLIGKPSKYKCETCGRFFCNRCSLLRHQKTVSCQKHVEPPPPPPVVAKRKRVNKIKTENTAVALPVASEIRNDNQLGSNEHKFNNGNFATEAARSSYERSIFDASQFIDDQNLPRDTTPQVIQEPNLPIDTKSDVLHRRTRMRKGKCEACHLCKKRLTSKMALERHINRVHVKNASAPEIDRNMNSSVLLDNMFEPRLDLPTFGESVEITTTEVNENFVDNLMTANEDYQLKERDIKTEDPEKGSANNSANTLPKPATAKSRTCQICEKTLSNSVSLQRHQFLVHKINPTSRQTMKEETTPSHPSNDPNTTKQIDRADRMTPDIKPNVNNQVNISGSGDSDEASNQTDEAKTYVKCNMCNKSMYRANLKRHMVLVHKMARTAPPAVTNHKMVKTACEVCGMMLSKGNLLRHLRLRHKEEWERRMAQNKNVTLVKRKPEENVQNLMGNENQMMDSLNFRRSEIKSEPYYDQSAWIPTSNNIEMNTLQNQNPAHSWMQAPNNSQVNALYCRNLNENISEIHHQNPPPWIQMPNNSELDALSYRMFEENVHTYQNQDAWIQPSLQANALDNRTLYENNAGAFIGQNPAPWHASNNPNGNELEYRSLENRSNIHQDQAGWIHTPSNSSGETLGYQNLNESNSDKRSNPTEWIQAATSSDVGPLNYRKLEVHSSDTSQDQSTWIQQQSNNSEMGTLSFKKEDTCTDAMANEWQVDADVKPNTAECPICDKMVLTSELSSHKSNHELVCHICGKDDICLPDVSSHGMTHVASLTCEVCGYKAQGKLKLWEHMNAHFRVRPLICLECGWSFANSGSVQYHMKAQHAKEIVKCDHCEKTFVTEQAKRGHELSHYGTTCPFCKAEFERKKELGEHIRVNHRAKQNDS